MPGEEHPWRITWGSRSWTEADLTCGDLLELATLLGNDFRQMMPSLGPLHLASFITVLEARATGEKFPKVAARVKEAKAVDLYGALTVDEAVS